MSNDVLTMSRWWLPEMWRVVGNSLPVTDKRGILMAEFNEKEIVRYSMGNHFKFFNIIFGDLNSFFFRDYFEVFLIFDF